MPLGTETWWETALENVSWSVSIRTVSSCRSTAQFPYGLYATGQRRRISS